MKAISGHPPGAPWYGFATLLLPERYLDAGMKAMFSQMSDEGIDEILARSEPKRYTPYCTIDMAVYKEEIFEVRKQGIAYEREAYMEETVAFAIPIKANSRDLQAAIWAVGLTRQVPHSSIQEYRRRARNRT